MITDGWHVFVGFSTICHMMTMMTETHYLDTYMYLVPMMVSEREHGLLIFVWSDRLSCVFFVFPG